METPAVTEHACIIVFHCPEANVRTPWKRLAGEKNQMSFCVTYFELGSVHMWDETIGLPPCNAGKY